MATGDDSTAQSLEAPEIQFHMFPAAAHEQPSDALEPEDDLHVLPHEPFQMYFTSGTTSLPKAVILTHAIVCSHALGTVAEMRFHANDVWFHG